MISKIFVEHSLCAFKQKDCPEKLKFWVQCAIECKIPSARPQIFGFFFAIVFYFNNHDISLNSSYQLLYSDGAITAFYGAFGTILLFILFYHFALSF